MFHLVTCVGIVLVIVCWCVTAKGPPPLRRNELERVRRLSDKIHREDVLPFD
jgi:hypothetical protein